MAKNTVKKDDSSKGTKNLSVKHVKSKPNNAEIKYISKIWIDG